MVEFAHAAGLRILMEDFWTLYGGGAPPKSAQVQDIALWESKTGADTGYTAPNFPVNAATAESNGRRSAPPNEKTGSSVVSPI